MDVLKAELISSYVFDRTKKMEDTISTQPYMKEHDINKLKFHPVNLYKISGYRLDIADSFAYLLHYHDPSTNRGYFDFVDPDCLSSRTDNLAEMAMAWKMGLSYEEYIYDLEVET